MKGIASEKLILAIRSVAAGASWWDQTATSQIRAALSNAALSNHVSVPLVSETAAHSTDVASSINPLTRREQQTLALITKGKSSQEIAKVLYITPGTVRVHIHTILHKLQAADRLQAAAIALQKELIDKDLLSE